MIDAALAARCTAQIAAMAAETARETAARIEAAYAANRERDLAAFRLRFPADFATHKNNVAAFEAIASRRIGDSNLRLAVRAALAVERKLERDAA